MVAASLDQMIRQFWVGAECFLFNYRLERVMMGKEVIVGVYECIQLESEGEVFIAVNELLEDRLRKH